MNDDQQDSVEEKIPHQPSQPPRQEDWKELRTLENEWLRDRQSGRHHERLLKVISTISPPRMTVMEVNKMVRRIEDLMEAVSRGISPQVEEKRTIYSWESNNR